MEGEGAVQGVALPPERAVEYHRRQQKKQAEAEQGAVRALRREMPHQPEAAPGQHHVKQNGEELDEVQVGYGQIGDGGKKIEVGCVIVADRQLHGREAAPIPEGRGPLGEEHLVIGGLVVQQQGPEEEGQPNGQQGVQQPGTVAYLNNASITVNANAQDAVGDTMNAGKILIHGSAGDAAGYAMRGGKIYVRDHAGYRAGIHMKEYKKKVPIMIIGGCAGSFLGEYQAGGILIVLGLQEDHHPIIGNFPCTGMHGGKLFLRGDCRNLKFPPQVTADIASFEDLQGIMDDLKEYCSDFHYDLKTILSSPFTLVTPNSKNPYKQMYVAN